MFVGELGATFNTMFTLVLILCLIQRSTVFLHPLAEFNSYEQFVSGMLVPGRYLIYSLT